MMNELEEAYMTMQFHCGIEVGDTVKVFRKAASHELGWRDIWDEGMDECIGNSFKVDYIASRGISFENVSFSFPFFVLEKIPKPHWRDTVSPENPVLCYVRDSENQEWCDNPLLAIEYTDQSEKTYPYRVNGSIYKHAKRVPKSVIESMLKAYDETSEDE